MLISQDMAIFVLTTTTTIRSITLHLVHARGVINEMTTCNFYLLDLLLRRVAS